MSKKAPEVLASRLKDKNLLEPETKITFYRTREKDLLPLENLVFCHDIRGLLGKMGLPEYFPDDWLLFIRLSEV